MKSSVSDSTEMGLCSISLNTYIIYTEVEQKGASTELRGTPQTTGSQLDLQTCVSLTHCCFNLISSMAGCELYCLSQHDLGLRQTH